MAQNGVQQESVFNASPRTEAESSIWFSVGTCQEAWLTSSEKYVQSAYKWEYIAHINTKILLWCKGGFPIKPHAKAEFYRTTVFEDEVGRCVSVPGGKALKNECVSPSEFLLWPLQESRLLQSKTSSCVVFLYTYLVPSSFLLYMEQHEALPGSHGGAGTILLDSKNCKEFWRGGMMVNLHYQPDWIWNHLGNIAQCL